MKKAYLIALLFVVSFLIPLGIYGQTEDLKQILSRLLEEVQTLQKRVEIIDHADLDEDNDWCGVNINSNLGIGSSDKSTGSEVSSLQAFLKKNGYYEYPTITGYFGPITQRAVQKFQADRGIVSSGTPWTTGYGVVGPMTRRVLSVCENDEPKNEEPIIGLPYCKSPDIDKHFSIAQNYLEQFDNEMLADDELTAWKETAEAVGHCNNGNTQSTRFLVSYAFTMVDDDGLPATYVGYIVVDGDTEEVVAFERCEGESCAIETKWCKPIVSLPNCIEGSACFPGESFHGCQ